MTRFKNNQALLNSINQGEQLLIVKLKKNEIPTFIKENKNLILLISQNKKLQPLMESQAQASLVNPNAFDGYRAQGQNIDILFTEMTCPNSSWFNHTRYSVLDGTGPGTGGADSDHARIVGDIIRYGANQANLYCAYAYNSQSSQYNNAPDYIDVENYSWGDELPAVDNVYDALSADLDNHIYYTRKTACVAAGNYQTNYSNTKYVSSPAKALNAITVGSYSGSKKIMDSSSWKNSEMYNEKPEVVAIGALIQDDKIGPWQFNGTSYASPHVAAIAANYMSQLAGDWYRRPMGIKALVMATATDNVEERDDFNNPWDDKSTGVGGVQYHDFFINRMQVWEMFDGTSNEFTRSFYVPQNAIDQGRSLRIVLTWIGTGDYAIRHKGFGKIGIDLDMRVNDPNGAYKKGSFSANNPYEMVDFKPTVAGYYTIRVDTYAYRDRSSYKKMGMAAVLY